MPAWDADTETLKLFPAEAPTDVQRFHTCMFITGTLYEPIAADMHQQNNEPAQFTPAMLVEQHAASMDDLSAMYRHTNSRFSLTHLLGAVKREYGKLRYVQEEQGNRRGAGKLCDGRANESSHAGAGSIAG